MAIPPILVAQIGMEVARGLAYAHRLTENGQSLELVHRDVTPAQRAPQLRRGGEAHRLRHRQGRGPRPPPPGC